MDVGITRSKRVGVAAGSLGVLALIAVAMATFLGRDEEVFRAVRIGTVALLPRDGLQARLAAYARSWNEAEFVIHAGPYVSRRTRRELGAELDSRVVYESAASLGRTGQLLTDLATHLAAARRELHVSWQPSIDRARLASALDQIRAQIERAPVPGSYGQRGELIAGIPGQTVNSALGLEQLEAALRSGAASTQLPVSTIRPPDPLSYAAAHSNAPNQLLYAAETLYPGGRAGRSKNIEVSVASIDGVAIDPGEEFSFNRAVGERSYARGFVSAKELANRRVVEGIGGGVCQVAATLHAAAFLAGMEIPVYRPHSRPVSYIPLGLDAMVSWPDKDLRIRNPYPFSVAIRAVATTGLVRVELLGSGRPHPVEWSTRILERIDPGEKLVFETSLRPGAQRVIQDSVDGLVVERVRTVYAASGPETTTVNLRYPPTPRIIARGPGSRAGIVAVARGAR
jgi:vancomycin resistance protein YoaR